MAADQTASVPAGWYPDPYGMSEMRWWDGQNWTDSVHPPIAETPEAAPVAPPQAEPEVSPLVVPEAAPVVAQEVVPEAVPVVTPEATPQVPVAPPTEHVQAEPAPSAELPPTEPPATRLPSRREMRLRNELETEAPSSVSAFSTLGISVEPELDPDAEFPVEHEPTPHTEWPPPITATDAPPVALSEPAQPAPDSSTPTAFDWLAGVTSGTEVQLPAATTADAQADAPAGSSPASPTASPLAPPAATAMSAPTSPPISAGGFSDPPVGVTDAWTRESSIVSVADDNMRPTATRKTTVSGWFIAAMPLLAGVLSISAVKGQENYPRYVPAELEWWMLVIGVVAGLYLVTLLLAVSDSHKLDWAGYNRPAHWAWSLLTAPVYLLVRTIAVKRETGRTSVLLLVWLVLAAAVVGAWFAAGYFAPELMADYPLPFG